MKTCTISQLVFKLLLFALVNKILFSCQCRNGTEEAQTECLKTCKAVTGCSSIYCLILKDAKFVQTPDLEKQSSNIKFPSSNNILSHQGELLAFFFTEPHVFLPYLLFLPTTKILCFPRPLLQPY